jgi:septum formation protein
VRIILGSQSLYRKKALDILNLKYETISSNFDEKSIRDKDPQIMAKKLAEAKALSIAENQNDALIITADLFLVFENQIYEKPISIEQAKEFLRGFSGNVVEVISGLAVYNTETKEMQSTVEVSNLKFRKLDEAEIIDYVNKYPVLKCAGGFERDGILRFCESISGSYCFYAGLPVNKLIEFLKKFI